MQKVKGTIAPVERWGPLDGVRILDFSWVVAGPQATRILADFGAQVIKVEYEGRPDPIRFSEPVPAPESVPSGAEGPVRSAMEGNLNRSGMFNNLNRNKLGFAVNAVHPTGLYLLKQLVALSDVVVENFRPHVMESWGLGYREMVAINPGIIYVSVSGFGHAGRNATYSTWGPTAQALSGLTFMSGLPGEAPAGWGYSYMDHSAGYYGAAAILMALHHRQCTGEGQYVDISQVECGMVLTGPVLLDFSVNGRPYRRPGNPPGNRSKHPEVAPHGVYRCAGDDRWIALAVMTDEQWERLAAVMGRPPWATEERFATMDARYQHQDELDGFIGAWTCHQDARELTHRLQDAGVAAGMVQNARDRLENDPQLRERGFYAELEHPVLGRRRFEGMPARLSETVAALRRPGPVMGQDNAFVLGQILGLNQQGIDTLAEEAVW